MYLFLLFCSCSRSEVPSKGLVQEKSRMEISHEPNNGLSDSNREDEGPSMPLIMISGRIHPKCDGMALIDILPLDGLDPEPLMTENVSVDGQFTIEIPQLTPVGVHCSCYQALRDVENDTPLWRVQPLSLKPLEDSVTGLVLFQEGMRPDHAPIEGVTLEEAIEIVKIRRAATLPEIIGPTHPSEQENVYIIENEYFEQGPTQSPDSNSSNQEHNFWVLFYGLEPNAIDDSERGREESRQPVGTSSSRLLGTRSKDLDTYFTSIFLMVKEKAEADGIDPSLLLPERTFIDEAVMGEGLFTKEVRLIKDQLESSCEILKLSCPPPSIILRQRFVLNDKREVSDQNDGAALSAYLWVKSEHLIREAQAQGKDPLPYLSEINSLVEAATLPPNSTTVQLIIEKLKLGYSDMNISFTEEY